MKKTNCSTWLILLVCAFIFPEGVTAAENPTAGLLYSSREVHSMRYDCRKNPDNSMTCEFVQVSVAKKSKPEDLEDKLKQAREEFRTKRFRYSEDECRGIATALDILEGRKKEAEVEAKFAEMDEIEKRDTGKIWAAISGFCKNRSENDLLNAVRLMHDIETRTCRASINPYKQIFILVRDQNTKTETWVVKQDGPDGPCGIVQLSRFEPVREGAIIFWKYISRRAITNPQGKFFGTMTCKDLDESEFVYDWRFKSHTIGCDYIEFSAF